MIEFPQKPKARCYFNNSISDKSLSSSANKLLCQLKNLKNNHSSKNYSVEYVKLFIINHPMFYSKSSICRESFYNLQTENETEKPLWKGKASKNVTPSGKQTTKNNKNSWKYQIGTWSWKKFPNFLRSVWNIKYVNQTISKLYTWLQSIQVTLIKFLSQLKTVTPKNYTLKKTPLKLPSLKFYVNSYERGNFKATTSSL